MHKNFIAASVGVVAILGAAACTTTDPYSSTPTRNNTGTSVAGYLWAQTGQHDDEARSSEQLAQALHEEVLSCE